MNYVRAISLIQWELKRRIKNKEVAEKLNVSKQYINNIEQQYKGETNLTQALKERLEVAFGVSLVDESSPLHTRNDGYDIQYVELVKEFPFLYNPNFRSCWFEKEIIKDWNFNKEDLRCFRIFNDKMDAGNYKFRENDLAVLNIADTDYSDGGAYLFTTERDGNKKVYFSYVEPAINPTEVVFTTAKYPEKKKIISLNLLEEYNFTIIGRVFKNMTFKV